MDVDSALSISISPDAMTATVVVARQFSGALTREALLVAVAGSGIALPVDDTLVHKLLAAHHAGVNISGQVIARGIAPKPPLPPQVALLGDPEFPVFPGDVVAYVQPATAGEAGQNLLGAAVPPRPPAAQAALPATSPETGVTRVGEQFFALRCGLVHLDEAQLGIREIFHPSLDQMELRGTIFSHDFAGRKISVSRIRQALLAMGVALPPCLLPLEQALAEAELSGRAQEGVLLASGFNPRPGQDGYLDMHIREERFKAGFTDAQGRIDYRQRGRLPTVGKGELMATYVEATRGHPGRTIDNRPIPTMPGRNHPVRPGSNVVLGDDRHSFYAQTNGLLIFKDNLLSVSEVYYVNGNVDMHTGHLEMDKGSIQVKGSVLAGFHLSCPGSIVVENTVEDARLSAGGDIEIAGGLVMTGKGLVQAGGNVLCLFASKARIDAEGDVAVVNELTNCQVLADGNVTVSGGNSKIIGGTIQAGESISALEIGTPLGSRTVIHLGLDEGFLYKKNQEAATIRSSLRPLEAKLGPGSSLDILARFPPQEEEHIARLIHNRNLLTMLLKQLEERIARCEAKISRGASCVLKVLGTIHQGTVLHCQGKSMTLRAPLELSQISFDFKRKQFKIGQLHLSGGRKR